tara:strand:+ start:426 stop:623 length:198 start_codon:yes stop_codon:yes gene_type:complete
MNIKTVKKNLLFDTKLDAFTDEVVSYQVTQEGSNIVLSVPINENNTEYQAIQKWVAEGNTIEDAD